MLIASSILFAPYSFAKGVTHLECTISTLMCVKEDIYVNILVQDGLWYDKLLVIMFLMGLNSKSSDPSQRYCFPEYIEIQFHYFHSFSLRSQLSQI